MCSFWTPSKCWAWHKVELSVVIRGVDCGLIATRNAFSGKSASQTCVLVTVGHQVQAPFSQDLGASPTQYARYQRVTISKVQSIWMSLRSRHRHKLLHHRAVKGIPIGTHWHFGGDCHVLQGVGQNCCGCGPAIVSNEVFPVPNRGCGCTLGKPTVDQTVI